MAIRVVIADDHRMIRDALSDILSRETDIDVVASASNGLAALAEVIQHQPDVLVIDIAMPGLNGIEVTRKLHTDFPKVKVLALSAYTDKYFVQEMLKAGAKGYICKSAAAGDLAVAIRTLFEGKHFLGSEIASAMIGNLAPSDSAEPPPASTLAPREREALRLLADGQRSADIAIKMNISVATVEVYRRNIMQKLNLHTVADLTKYAIREGLASL
jgi:DNA-binding NarL/FixJ family response regulator